MDCSEGSESQVRAVRKRTFVGRVGSFQDECEKKIYFSESVVVGSGWLGLAVVRSLVMTVQYAHGVGCAGVIKW